MSKKHPPEPTCDQCSNNEKLPDFEGQPCFAVWYPQMGGYVAKAVVVKESDVEGQYKEDGEGCFGIYVWHNGEFPFTADDDNNEVSPFYLHHCSPSQFIEFGETVIEKSKEYFR